MEHDETRTEEFRQRLIGQIAEIVVQLDQEERKELLAFIRNMTTQETAAEAREGD